jgi:hypothetical protein
VRLRRSIIAMIALALGACRSGPRSSERDAWPAAAKDPTEACADLTNLRICWSSVDDGGPSTIHKVDRTLPNARPASPLGWRCSGVGAARTCVDRQRGVGAFAQNGERWLQRHPRLPDDGEWSCGEMGGAVVCSGGATAAGVAAKGSDPAWFCGKRWNGMSSAETIERVCVDFAPDFPDGSAIGWRCRYEQEQGLARVCQRNPSAHVLGDACDAGRPCLDGVRCVERKCVPERPAPSCVIDADCESTACRLGTCREPSP